MYFNIKEFIAEKYKYIKEKFFMRQRFPFHIVEVSARISLENLLNLTSLQVQKC